MGVRIREWLEAQGFQSNPFEFWEADREADLDAYFVRSEWFDAFFGDVANPRSSVLFAPRGHGKSSHRIQVARRAADGPRGALVIEITSYDWLLAEGLDGVDKERYRRFLARSIASALWERLAESRQRHAALAADPLRLLQLAALLTWADERLARRIPLPALDAEQLQNLAWQLRLADDPPPSPAALIAALAEEYRAAGELETVRELIDLARAARFPSIYVLLDRIDEDQLTEHDVEAAIRLIQPLVSNLHLLELRGIAFKLFLPEHIREAMQARQISRVGERVPAYQLRWSDDDLCELLARRLQAYSQSLEGGPGDIAMVGAFQDLCEPGLDADRALVAAARGSPRSLIRIAGGLVELHCQRAGALTEKIGPATLAAVTRPHGPPPLYLDPAGFVWIGGQRRAELKLTPLPRKILEHLWHNRGRYITREELRTLLFPKAQEEDALYKNVTRLREQLEPGLRNSKHYVDFVEGHGFRLQHYADSPP